MRGCGGGRGEGISQEYRPNHCLIKRLIIYIWYIMVGVLLPLTTHIFMTIHIKKFLFSKYASKSLRLLDSRYWLLNKQNSSINPQILSPPGMGGGHVLDAIWCDGETLRGHDLMLRGKAAQLDSWGPGIVSWPQPLWGFLGRNLSQERRGAPEGGDFPHSTQSWV